MRASKRVVKRKTSGGRERNEGGRGLDPAAMLTVLAAVKRGDFSVRLPVESTGLAGRVVDMLNEIIELNQKLAAEICRVSNVVGKEGRISQRVSLSGASGAWAESIECVNSLVTDLVRPT